MSVIGASRSPTPYKLKTPKTQYVFCGADILLNGIRRDLEGEGTCTVCGRSTHISLVGGRLRGVEPASAVLHVVEVRSPGRTQIVCEGSPLFDREDCLQAWLKSYTGLPGRIYGVREFMARASELVEERVGPARLEKENQSLSGTVRVMRCADCGCSPAECARAKTASDCPSCTLESCCCWIASKSA